MTHESSKVGRFNLNSFLIYHQWWFTTLSTVDSQQQQKHVPSSVFIHSSIISTIESTSVHPQILALSRTTSHSEPCCSVDGLPSFDWSVRLNRLSIVRVDVLSFFCFKGDFCLLVLFLPIFLRDEVHLANRVMIRTVEYKDEQRDD